MLLNASSFFLPGPRAVLERISIIFAEEYQADKEGVEEKSPGRTNFM
jgi:hypothetical protein